MESKSTNAQNNTIVCSNVELYDVRITPKSRYVHGVTVDKTAHYDFVVNESDLLIGVRHSVIRPDQKIKAPFLSTANFVIRDSELGGFTISTTFDSIEMNNKEYLRPNIHIIGPKGDTCKLKIDSRDIERFIDDFELNIDTHEE
jgi:hypothetical protein